jgi:hypothetical protein
MSLQRNAGLRAQNTARHNIAPSAEAGPPSKPNTPAAVMAAKGITTNSPGTKMTYSGPNQPSTSAPVGGRGFTCPCGRSFVAKPGLARHQKDCGSRDISKCQFCEASFPSFIGVRQHERRAHPDLYKQDLEARLPEAESSLLAKIAKVEASNTTGIFYNDMVAATGLTKHQIRHRRDKPQYKLYLENARKELAASSSTMANVPKSLTRETAASPPKSERIVSREDSSEQSKCTGAVSRGMRTRAAAARAARLEKESGQQTGPTTRARVPSPRRSPENKRELNSMPLGGPALGIPPADGQSSSKAEAEMYHRSEREGAASPLGIPTQPSVQGPVTERPAQITLGQEFIISPRAIANGDRPSHSLPATVAQTEEEGSTDLTGGEEICRHLERCLATPREVETGLSGVVLAALRGQGTQLVREIDSWLSRFSQGKPGNGEEPRRRTKRRRSNFNSNAPEPRTNIRNYGLAYTGGSERASLYKKAQDLYRKNRAGLAEVILGGKPLAETVKARMPSLRNVEDLYGGILESPSPADDAPFEAKIVERSESLQPITEDEVRDAKTGWSHSAAGPDRVSVAAVKASDDSTLATFFNVLLLRGVQPTVWRDTRTILIPKGGDPTNAENWRPITIGSAIQRLFHRVLLKRLKSQIGLSMHQRGFVNTDGTLANILILDQYITERTLKGKAYSVISLDVRKAFDTVSHNSIRRAMERFRLHPIIASYIMSTFSSTTTIKVGNEQTRPLRIMRGVRQGDPLSPLLFNMVVDELLEKVNSNFRGGSLPHGSHCAAMAFADDLVMLSDSDVEAPLMLKEVETFLRERGMGVNPAKCRALCTGVIAGRAVGRTVSTYRINNLPIPAVGHMDTFRYLGHSYGYDGVGKPSLFNLTVWLENVRRAPLKPDQKLLMIKTYVIPRLLYGLQTPKVTSKVLREADRLMRKFVRATLHLNAHTPDALIHASVRDGGLGVTELRGAIPRILLGRMTKLLESPEDRVICSLLQSSCSVKLMGRLQNMMGNIPEATKWRDRIKAGSLTKGLEQTAEDPASRGWVLERPNGWTGRDFVRAVQLRTANLPTRAIPSAPVGQRRCRGGCAVDESLSHVLQTCPITHWERIHRHNEIVGKIARHCKNRGWEVEEEPHVRHSGGQLFKPDLVIHQPGGRTIVADIQVSWESTELGVAYVRKQRKYDNPFFRDAASKRWPGKTLEFAPVIVGARGIWPRINNTSSDVLQIPASIRRACVHAALKWGSSIHRAFSRAVWSKPGGAPAQCVN